MCSTCDAHVKKTKSTSCLCQKSKNCSEIMKSKFLKLSETAYCAPYTEGSLFRTFNNNSFNFSGGLCNCPIGYCVCGVS